MGGTAEANPATQDTTLPEIQHQSPIACEEPLATFTPSASFVLPGSQFDAEYTPSAPGPTPDFLYITHRTCIDFQPFSSRLIRDQPDLFAAYRGVRFSAEQRAAFEWTDAQRATFKADYWASVNRVWSGRHVFATNEPCFAHYRATPLLEVKFVDTAQAAHSTVVAYKLPPDAARLRSRVRRHSAASLDSRDPTVEESRWLLPALAVRQVGPFDFDGADVNAEVDADVHALAAELRPHADMCNFWDPFGPDGFLAFRGRASAEGSARHNQELAQRRAAVVRARMNQVLGLPPPLGTQYEVQPAEENATTDAAFRRVDVRFRDGHNVGEGRDVQHNVAAHEFGHLLGLGDEYQDETPPRNVAPKFEGDHPSHYDDVEAAMGSSTANELLIQNTDSIMSQGNEVRRGHYVYFLTRLSAMTHKAWVIE